MAVTICSGVGEYFGMSLPVARFYANLKNYLVDDLNLAFPPDGVEYKEYFVRAFGINSANNCVYFTYDVFLRRADDTLVAVGTKFYSITGNPAGSDPCSQNPDPIPNCNACAGLPSDSNLSSVELGCVVHGDTFAECFNAGVIDEIGTNNGLFIRGVGFSLETGFLIGSEFDYTEGDPFTGDIETFDIACVWETLENVVSTGSLDVDMVDCLIEINNIICCTKFPAKCKLIFFDDYELNVPPIGSVERVFFIFGFYFPHLYRPNLGGLELEQFCYYKSFTFEDIDVAVQNRKTDYQKLITDYVQNFNEIQREKQDLLSSINGYTMQNQGEQINPLGILEGYFSLLMKDGTQVNFLFNNTGEVSEDVPPN